MMMKAFLLLLGAAASVQAIDTSVRDFDTGAFSAAEIIQYDATASSGGTFETYTAVDKQLDFGDSSDQFSIPPFNGDVFDEISTYGVQFPRQVLETAAACTLSCGQDSFVGGYGLVLAWANLNANINDPTTFDNMIVFSNTCNIQGYLKYVTDLGEDSQGVGEGAFLRVIAAAQAGISSGQIKCDAIDPDGCLKRVRNSISRFFSG